MLLFRESIRGFFCTIEEKAKRILIPMPWIRLRHHCRFFFRQFISPDMMIFQEDMVQRKSKRLQRLLPDSRFQFTFPDNNGMPSHFCQPMQHFMVPFPVSPDFLHPEPGIRFRNHVILASLMSMPEASIHQNAGAILPQHNIRFSRQPWMIEPIPESPSPQELPDKNLRFGILASDCRHIMVALFYGHFIWHTLYLLRHLFSNQISFSNYMLLYMKIFRKLRNFSRIHCQTQNRQQAVDDFKMLFLIHENYISATACIL